MHFAFSYFLEKLRIKNLETRNISNNEETVSASVIIHKGEIIWEAKYPIGAGVNGVTFTPWF